MKSWRSAVLVGALLLTLMPTPAIAAIKVGAVCKKPNQIQKFQGQQYKCLKSGGKFKWKPFELKAPSASTATPEMKPVESPTSEVTEVKVGDVCSNSYKGYVKTTSITTLRCNVANDGTLRWLDDLGLIPDPTPKKKAVLLPTNFENIFDNAEGSATAAWNSVDSKIRNSPATSVKFNVYVGPNTNLLNSRVDEAYERAIKVFHGFRQPQSFSAIYYKYQDVEWARSKSVELQMPARVKDEILSACSSITKCNGASAGKSGDTSGFIQSTVGSLDVTMLTGGLEMHEYSHIAQAMQFIGKPRDDFNFRYLPNWLLEGHAHVVGIVGSATTLETYLLNRKTWLNDYPKKGTGTFSVNDVENFYDALMPGKPESDLQGFVYSLGYITIEYLVALKGVDSPMQLILDISEGLSFEDAFKKNYGVEWATAKPLLAKAIHKEFNKG